MSGALLSGLKDGEQKAVVGAGWRGGAGNDRRLLAEHADPPIS